MKRLAILGAGGHGKVVADIALQTGWDEAVFFDDVWPDAEKKRRWPVVGNSTSLLQRVGEFAGVIVAIGNGIVRLRRHEEFRRAGAKLATLIHPSASISEFAVAEDGFLVCAGAVVNTDARIGASVIINSGATVDHDCVLDDGVHVAPGAHLSGNVRVGSCSWLGVGSCVKQGVRIGANVVVGAGTVVIDDIPDGVTVVGNPARQLRGA